MNVLRVYTNCAEIAVPSIRFYDRHRSFTTAVNRNADRIRSWEMNSEVITDPGIEFKRWSEGRRTHVRHYLLFTRREIYQQLRFSRYSLRDRHDRCVVKHNGAYSTRRCSPTEHGSRVPSRMCARALLFLFWRTLVSHSTRNPISSPLSRLSRLTGRACIIRPP